LNALPTRAPGTAAMCKAALLGIGVTMIAKPDPLPYLESCELVLLAPNWYVDAGPISIYYASRTLLPSRTQAFVDFVVEVFQRERWPERFAGSLV
jgi:DNA-binding transcriptional LysR family regulator